MHRRSAPSASLRRSCFVLLLFWALAPVHAQAPASLTDSAFAHLVATLSEPPGYFDTDNLISNEDSYLHVIGTLKRLGVTGGAYLGVGPDQNFSYIAAIRPRVAFIVDIRRENLLQHLMFKSMFALARNRIEYMCVLFGKTAPADTTGWGAHGIAALLAYIDTSRTSAAAVSRIRARVLDHVRKLPVPLSADEITAIGRIHGAFIEQGPALTFNSFGRAPQPYYPNYRRLLTETDRTGRQSNFLAHEADFQVVKSLHARNLIIPVVGDFGGTHALPAVARWLRTNRETVSAFYTSNVEQYLFRGSGFTTFAGTVSDMPRTPKSVMLRSYFQGAHPNAVPGYHVTQVAQYMDRFVGLAAKNAIFGYRTLVMQDIINQ
jgi:hypothetical protein